MKKILTLLFFYALSISLLINYNPKVEQRKLTREGIAHQEEQFDGPAEFAKFHWEIRTADGESGPSYRKGYKLKELAKAKKAAAAKQSRTQSNGVIAWNERGPSNVPGRTRGLIVDPIDPAKNTWYAGSVGGGVWKTTNAGQSWTNLTPDLPNLSTSVLAMAPSNQNTIYCGTGEGFFNLDAIDGAGIFKSTDRGITWTHLSSTSDFPDVNRILVDPSNENIVLAATADGLFRSTSGGTSWTKVLNEDIIQDLKSTPGNFNILYAAQNSVGVWKSTNAGVTWSLTSSLGSIGRIELAVSPVNTSRIFVSAEQEAFGAGSLLFLSDDGGSSWQRINVSIAGNVVDFLNEQGWYDNTIECDPFNQNVVYYGGVDLFRTQLTSGSSNITVLALETENTDDFLELTNFTGASNGNFDVGPNANNTSVEFRFGPGQTQKAHRFTVPVGATSGVPAANYTFAGYVDVPFTVWDVSTSPNRQLMVSFRDQANNGIFDLIPSNTTSSNAAEQSREYVFINDVAYSNTQNSSIATSGGHEFREMYNLWPVLASGGIWPPTSNGVLRIKSTQVPLLNASTVNLTDGRGEFGNNINNNVHVDHHNLIMIPMTANTFKILNANDGGVFVSNTAASPGINNGNWTATDNGYNSSQFYGADKRPGSDQYFGGMQDNGTWLSPAGQNASEQSDYSFKIGGDGFEVIWNYQNPQLLIGGSQGNIFARSSNGGTSFTNATSGLSGSMPFISKLANSNALPDRIFTLGQNGVFVSTNFGTSWTLTPITQKWANSSLMDIDVSRANSNIVWAGTGMTANLNLHVSTDGGKTFSITNNYTTVSMGGITKLATHPIEPSTAYALFSLSGKPKILKTTNLGVTWTDQSGFGTNSTSSTGFPDVAVYCLYVRPDNTNIIWAGTEIGIVESVDGGASWAIINDFPNVSVWDLKGVDNQIVIATHGRGIWTATVSADQVDLPELPSITAAGTSPSEKIALLITNPEVFDSIQVLVNSEVKSSIKNPTVGSNTLELSGVPFGSPSLSLQAYKNGAPYTSKPLIVKHTNLLDEATSLVDYFNTLDNLVVSDFQQNIFTNQIGDKRSLHTRHPYSANSKAEAFIKVPIIITEENATLRYKDVAIVEPSNDFVSVEGTLDGITWRALKPAYNASKNDAWLTTYSASSPNNVGSSALLVEHEINLLDFFAPGDKVLIRFKLTSNASIQAWGWAIDYVAIQDEPTGVEISVKDSPHFTLFPNPTNREQEVFLKYVLTKTSSVKIEVIDVLGNKLFTSGNHVKNAGEHIQPLFTSQLSSGSYIAVLTINNTKHSTRWVLR